LERGQQGTQKKKPGKGGFGNSQDQKNLKKASEYSPTQVGLSMLVLVGQRNQAVGEKDVMSGKKNQGEGKKSNRKGGKP